MRHNGHAADVSTGLRDLNAAKHPERQLEIVHTLLAALTTDPEPLPYPVASHIAQRVVDWATNTLRSQTSITAGSKRKRGGGHTSPWTPAQRWACWAALHTALGSQHAVNASPALWAAVHHALTESLTDDDGSQHTLEHVQGVVEQLTGGVLSTAAQPTPEQLCAVVHAASRVLGDRGDGLVVNALTQAVVGYTAVLLQAMPNQRKAFTLAMQLLPSLGCILHHCRTYSQRIHCQTYSQCINTAQTTPHADTITTAPTTAPTPANTSTAHTTTAGTSTVPTSTVPTSSASIVKSVRATQSAVTSFLTMCVLSDIHTPVLRVLCQSQFVRVEQQCGVVLGAAKGAHDGDDGGDNDGGGDDDDNDDDDEESDVDMTDTYKEEEEEEEGGNEEGEEEEGGDEEEEEEEEEGDVRVETEYHEDGEEKEGVQDPPVPSSAQAHHHHQQQQQGGPLPYQWMFFDATHRHLCHCTDQQSASHMSAVLCQLLHEYCFQHRRSTTAARTASLSGEAHSAPNPASPFWCMALMLLPVLDAEQQQQQHNTSVQGGIQDAVQGKAQGKVQGDDDGGVGGTVGSMPWGVGASVAADLLDTAHQLVIYSPTIDQHGHLCQVLTTLATLALAHISSHAHTPSPTPHPPTTTTHLPTTPGTPKAHPPVCSDPATTTTTTLAAWSDTTTLAASLQLLRQVLVLEHRALRVAPGPLWRLLWECCGGAGGGRDGGAPNEGGAGGDHGSGFTPRSIPPASPPPSVPAVHAVNCAPAPAVYAVHGTDHPHLPHTHHHTTLHTHVAALAAEVVTTYAEVRQLPVLLRALLESIHVAGDGAGAVVGSPVLLERISTCVHKVPTGQSPLLVEVVVSHLHSLAAAQQEYTQHQPQHDAAATPSAATPSATTTTGVTSSDVPLAALQLACACEVACCVLHAIQVNLPTAHQVALSLQSLMEGPWAAWFRGALVMLAQGKYEGSMLGVMGVAHVGFRVWTSVCRLHGACAALLPDILPLPGQSTEPPSVNTTPAQQPPSQQPPPPSPTTDHWAAALPPIMPPPTTPTTPTHPRLPSLMHVVNAALTTANTVPPMAAAQLKLCLVQVVAARCVMLQERWQRCAATCPLVMVGGGGGGVDTGDDMQASTSKELHDLAACLVSLTPQRPDVRAPHARQPYDGVLCMLGEGQYTSAAVQELLCVEQVVLQWAPVPLAVAFAEVLVDLATLHMLHQPPAPPHTTPTTPSHTNPTTPSSTTPVCCMDLAYGAVLSRHERQCICMPQQQQQQQQQQQGVVHKESGTMGDAGVYRSSSGGVLMSEDVWVAAMLRMLHGALRPINDALARASPPTRRPPSSGPIATPASVVATLVDAVAPRAPPWGGAWVPQNPPPSQQPSQHPSQHPSSGHQHPPPTHQPAKTHIPDQPEGLVKALRLTAKHLNRWQTHALTTQAATPLTTTTTPASVRHTGGGTTRGPAPAAVGTHEVPCLLQGVALMSLIDPDPITPPPPTPHRAHTTTLTLVTTLLATAATAAAFLAATGPPRRPGGPSPSVAALCQLACRAMVAVAGVMRTEVQGVDGVAPNTDHATHPPPCAPLLDVLPPSRLLPLLLGVSRTITTAALVAGLHDTCALSSMCASGCSGVVFWVVRGLVGGLVLRSESERGRGEGGRVVEGVLEPVLVMLEDDEGAAQALTTGLTLLHGHPPPPIPPPPPSSPTTSPPQHHHHGTPRSTYPTCIPGTSRVTDPSVGVLVHAAGCSVTHVALACVAAAVEAAAGKAQAALHKPPTQLARVLTPPRPTPHVDHDALELVLALTMQPVCQHMQDLAAGQVQPRKKHTKAPRPRLLAPEQTAEQSGDVLQGEDGVGGGGNGPAPKKTTGGHVMVMKGQEGTMVVNTPQGGDGSEEEGAGVALEGVLYASASVKAVASVLVAGSELLILHNTLQAMETNGQHTNEPGQHTNEHGQHTNEHGQHTNEPGQHTNEHGQHDDNGVHNKEGEEDGMEENKRTREQRAHHDTRPPPPHDAHDTPPHDAHNTPSASSSSSGEVVPAVGVVAVGGMRKRGSRVTLTSRLPARQPPVIPAAHAALAPLAGALLARLVFHTDPPLPLPHAHTPPPTTIQQFTHPLTNMRSMISVDTMGMLIHALRRMTTGLMCGVGGAGGVGGGAYGGVGNGHGHHEQQQQLPQKLLALHIALLGNHLVLQQPPPPDWPRRTTLHTLPTAALPPHPTPHDTLCVAALTSLAACANSVHDAVVFGGLVEGCVASLQRLVEDDGGGNGGGTGDRGGSGGGDRGDRGGRGSGGGVHTTATVGVHGIGGGEKQEQHAAHVLPYVEFLLCCLEAPPSASMLPTLATHASAITHVLTNMLTNTAASPVVAAAACCACRVLESIVGRPVVFGMRVDRVKDIMNAVVAPLQACVTEAMMAGRFGGRGDGVGVLGGIQSLGCVYTAATRVLHSCVRHRPTKLRKCPSLLLNSLRTLLLVLVQWCADDHTRVWWNHRRHGGVVGERGGGLDAPGKGGEGDVAAVYCAMQVAQVYEELSSMDALDSGRYCALALMDYVRYACAVPPAYAVQDSRESWLPPQAAVALQRGACALYNACSERERQWVFSCVTRRLARDVVGSVHRREALLGLQRVYESTYKYAGRV